MDGVTRFGALAAAVVLATMTSAGCIEGSTACEPACEAGATCLNGQCVTPVCDLDCGTAGSCIIRADSTPGCACDEGYALTPAGDGCVDVDECAGGAVCDAAATCTNTEGSYTCTCPEFWTGDGMQEGCVSPCAVSPCLNGGTCSEEASAAGGFACSCAPGWTGDLCVDADTDCTPESCDDGDACTEDNCAGTTCTHPPIVCDDGDACTDDACDSSTGCTATPVVCDDGDPCTDDSCDPTAGCASSPTVCDDGDPCTVDSCDSTGCTSTPDPCDDGDPCTFDSCGDAGCLNALAQEVIADRTYRFCPGLLTQQEAAAHCAGEAGWNLVALETLVESSAIGTAAEGYDLGAFWMALVSNSGTWEWPDGPTAGAEEGWCPEQPEVATDGTCAVANACDASNTWASATCGDSYAFVCELPQPPPDPCDPNPCMNGGTCLDEGAGLFSCNCVPQWSGPTCEEAVVDVCDPNPCMNGGTCADNGDTTFTCTCEPMWTGPTCEEAAGNPCDPSPCLNGGTCMNDSQAPDGYMCECVDDWTGKDCENGPTTSDCPTPCTNIGDACGASDCPPGGDECTCTQVPMAPPGECSSVGTIVCTPGCSLGNCPSGFSCDAGKCKPTGGMSGGGGNPP